MNNWTKAAIVLVLGSFNVWAILICSYRGAAFQNIDPVVGVLSAYAATHIEWLMIKCSIWCLIQTERMKADAARLAKMTG